MNSIGQKKSLPRIVLGKKSTGGGITLGLKRPAAAGMSGSGLPDIKKSPLER